MPVSDVRQQLPLTLERRKISYVENPAVRYEHKRFDGAKVRGFYKVTRSPDAAEAALRAANKGKIGARPCRRPRRTFRKNRKRKSVPVLGAAGLSLSLAAGTPTALSASANDMPTCSVPLSHS